MAPHVISVLDRRHGLRGWSEVELLSDAIPRRRIDTSVLPLPKCFRPGSLDSVVVGARHGGRRR